MFVISANRLRNWLAEDPLLDWLEQWGVRFGFQKSPKTQQNPFQDWIHQNGFHWEEQQIKKIQNQTAIPFRIFSNNPPQTPQEWKDRSEETIEAMTQKVPLIVHPVLCTSLDKMFPEVDSYQQRDITFWGIPDILIHRSLYNDLPCLQHLALPKKGEYLVGDWKQNTMIVNMHGDLRIQRRFHSYFSQVWLYQHALNAMKPKSVIMEYGGLIPKEYRVGAKGFRQEGGIFTSLGFLTCHMSNELQDFIHQGIEWLWKCNEEGGNWDPRKDYTQIQELRPNMKNHRDERWHYAKTILGRMQQELTQLPYVTSRVRKRALENNSTIDFNPKTKRAKIVHKSLYNLHNPENNLSWEDEIRICRENNGSEKFDDLMQNPGDYRWIDLEFIPAGWFSSEQRGEWERVNEYERHSICVLIGWVEQGETWKHHQFELKEPTRACERNLWENINHECELNPNIIWVHWGSAEKTMFRQAVERGDLHKMPKMLDLMSFFQQVQFLPSPLLDFKLKSWGNLMTRRKLLPHNFPKEWEEDESDLGTFWIPAWLGWFQGTTDKPNSSSLLSYHRRDIYWLAAIHHHWQLQIPSRPQI